ncbi:MAG: GvpL/GvpF family gas vesicle protein [Thermostichales cyanobacterium DRC_bins_46]
MPGLYLYGMVKAPGPRHLAVTGLDQQPVQMMTLGSLVMFYSQALQDRYLASRNNLLTHQRVLEKIMQEGHRSVLPLQFGLVVTDWQQVHNDLLIPQQARLTELLQHLEGKREVGVKVFWDPQKELQLGLEENPDLKRRRDQMAGSPLGLDAVVRIGQELEQMLEGRRQGIARTFVERLRPLSSEMVVGELLTENMACNLAFLIPWEGEPEFAQQVERLDQEFQQRLRIRYNNFTAPYNFARL